MSHAWNESFGMTHIIYIGRPYKWDKWVGGLICQKEAFLGFFDFTNSEIFFLDSALNEKQKVQMLIFFQTLERNGSLCNKVNCFVWKVRVKPPNFFVRVEIESYCWIRQKQILNISDLQKWLGVIQILPAGTNAILVCVHNATK